MSATSFPNTNGRHISCSIVIASLGGASLEMTLDSIINGSYIPAEIVVVLPPAINYCYKHKNYADVNIYIYNSSIKGQVAQRLYGLSMAIGDIIIQSDDDIYFDKNCLHDLVAELCRLGKKKAIAPMLYNEKTRLPLANYVLEKPNLFRRLMLFIQGVSLSDSTLGNITKTGFAFLPILYEHQDSYEVEWLPGGVVASWRDELILIDFFPFSGKSYCEDLYNSIERSNAGIRQIIYKNIFAYTNPGVSLGFHEVLADHKVRINLVGFWRMPQYFLIFFASLILSLFRRNTG